VPCLALTAPITPFLAFSGTDGSGKFASESDQSGAWLLPRQPSSTCKETLPLFGWHERGNGLSPMSAVEPEISVNGEHNAVFA
jgi:hypothetical protein